MESEEGVPGFVLLIVEFVNFLSKRAMQWLTRGLESKTVNVIIGIV